MLRKFENIFIGPSSTWTDWTHIEHLLNACECTWMPISEWEQPLNTYWVRMNTIEWVWTPIEFAWKPMSHYWMRLTMGVTMRKIAFVSELNGPCILVSAHECLWVNIEHPLSAIECAWTPLSEYWTHPECLSVHMKANEWVGTAPEHPLSAHTCLWVSIWKVWMRTSKVVNLTNL